MKQVHGISDAEKVAMVANAGTQSVLVSDDGDGVLLTLSTSSYPARLTPQQAREIASLLADAANRAAAKIKEVKS